jgi:hypothetical protein
MVFLEFDTLGVAVIVILAAGFTLLLVGVYSSKSRQSMLNLVKHGFASTAATLITLVTAFAVMIPIFLKITIDNFTSSIFQFPIMWLHAVIGAISIISGLTMIAFWVRRPLSELGCAKRWRLMKPTIITWAVALALGALIHITGLR